MSFNVTGKIPLDRSFKIIICNYCWFSSEFSDCKCAHVSVFFFVSRSSQSFFLGSTQMHESSHHGNIFLSLSPKPTHFHLQRCTCSSLPASGWRKSVDSCWCLCYTRGNIWIILPQTTPCASLQIIIFICYLSPLCSVGCNFAQLSSKCLDFILSSSITVCTII